MIGSRENQEDSSLICEIAKDSALLLVTADGMGGHVGGEIASQSATKAFAECFEFFTVGPIHKRLRLSLLASNDAIAQAVHENEELDGMGTTLIAAYVASGFLHWISVGDSLILLYRDGGLWRLNADHSMVPLIEKDFDLGILSKNEADNHPERNVLRSALQGLFSPDLIDNPHDGTPLIQGDRLIIASDGIETLTPDIIKIVLDKNFCEDNIVEDFFNEILHANEEHQDNVTIQVVGIL